MWSSLMKSVLLVVIQISSSYQPPAQFCRPFHPSPTKICFFLLHHQFPQVLAPSSPLTWRAMKHWAISFQVSSPYSLIIILLWFSIFSPYGTYDSHHLWLAVCSRVLEMWVRMAIRQPEYIIIILHISVPLFPSHLFSFLHCSISSHLRYQEKIWAEDRM